MSVPLLAGLSIVPDHPDPRQCAELADRIRQWGRELGFAELRIGPARVPEADRRHLDAWLERGSHGDMQWMADRAALRHDPDALVPGVQRIISVRMDYFPPRTRRPAAQLADPEGAYVSRYALGRDYHKLLRKRLTELGRRIEAEAPHGYRAFTDSAPVLEKALAQQAGLGWIGKHTNLLARGTGSWFFLGELFTDLPLPLDPGPAEDHCGSCRACLDVCPTQAFRGPHDLDARRCISYLTIELKGSIPEDLRPLIGNRIYGCDDCQLVCPWNRFAEVAAEPDFIARHGLDSASLVELFGWDEASFLEHTTGMAIRRIGHEQWLRNLAVALGNGPATDAAREALAARAGHPSALVREHVAWARARLDERAAGRLAEPPAIPVKALTRAPVDPAARPASPPASKDGTAGEPEDPTTGS
ncbi:tRNA epoxyqueuosine(34) reductase QueG [Thioalkalivibrio halophilus]|uniref:Epoxyqueuosine reductase n=1 Tax=Thioalkalivibrio halophilus TaxID=252474 RepID=A0A1V2ZWD7_9GAMM|nr:tRNA epoxyqueuosine(34) reductase QueG [Thioalkalivibrio halophilus]OOC09447.1 tRNA epoxyqueuosine(34) reductase QueG [Thioalkalivibrio halophilus]